MFTIKILPQLPETCEQYFCSCLVRGDYRHDTDQIDYSIVEEETDGLSGEQITELDELLAACSHSSSDTLDLIYTLREALTEMHPLTKGYQKLKMLKEADMQAKLEEDRERERQKQQKAKNRQKLAEYERQLKALMQDDH